MAALENATNAIRRSSSIASSCSASVSGSLSASRSTSASLEPSYVLHGIGVGDDLAHTSIRFGIGRFNTVEEVDYVAQLVCEKVEGLRALSPLWEMVQEGIDLTTISWAAH